MNAGRKTAVLQVLSALWLATIALAVPVKAEACPTVPASIRDLDVPRFYGDTKGTVVDPVLQRAHDAAVKPLTDFVRSVTQASDKAVTRSSPKAQRAAASCALASLVAWARADALLGRMAQPQAEYQRKWDLAGLTLAYLKLKPAATIDEQRTIELWLTALADATYAFQSAPGRARNNHWYWTGLGQQAVGLATGNELYIARARAIFDDGVGQITADGFLPLELERGPRALFYHAFAAVPLVLMAEMAAMRGDDWYALQNGALHRFIVKTAQGLGNPQPFADAARVAQAQPVNPRVAWTQLYARRFPGRLAEPLPQMGTRHRWIGGDAFLLMDALEKPTKR